MKKGITLFLVVLLCAAPLGAEAPQSSSNAEVQDLLNQAALARSQNNLDQAIQSYLQAIAIEPGNFMLHRNLGVLYYEKTDYLAAAKAFLKTNQLKTDDLMTLIYTGKTLLKIDDLQAAKDYLTRAERIDPESPELNIALGDIDRKAGEYGEAQKHYQKATEASPQSADGYRGMGLIYYETHRYQMAVENFDEALKYASEDGDLWYNLGMSYYATNNLDKAAECMHRSLTCKPNNAETFNGLGLIFMKARQWELAEKSFSKAIELKPDYQEAKQNLEKLHWQRSSEMRATGPMEGAPSQQFGPINATASSVRRSPFDSPNRPTAYDMYMARRSRYYDPRMGGNPFINSNEAQPASGAEALMAVAQAIFGAISNRDSGNNS